MKKIRLGKTNMMVSHVGFGGIPIQRLNEEDAVNVVKRCFELGVTYFDTANGYTTSEERVGKALKGHRNEVIIATKSHTGSKDELLKNLELSLSRLGIEYIDLYQFHGVSDFNTLENIVKPDGLISVVEAARKKGLIKHIGITSHQIDVAKKAAASDKFETVMFPFNFIAPEAANELIPLCKQHDVGFICMKPLAGGMVDNARVAIKYLLQFPEIVAIPGIEKKAEIEEIVKIVESNDEMTIAEKAEMKHIKETLGSRFCHRCDYCQPCTMDIPISAVMTIKSSYKRLPTERFIKMVDTAMEKALTCSECGECEKRCPYNLPIREMIKEQRMWYQDLKAKYVK
jgi:uncharacterized protein